MRRALRATWLVGCASALATVAACDPCAGVVGCDVGPRVSYSGRVIDVASGQGVAGAEVSFARDSGVPMPNGLISSVTDAEGFYRFVGDADDAGSVFGTVRIKPPSRAGYEVAGVELATSDKRGAGGVLPTWLAEPRISFIGELQNRRYGGYVRGGHARFIRTGGARLVQDTVVANIDETGRFYMSAAAIDAGEAVGRLSVLNVLEREYTFETTIPVLTNERLPQLDRVWSVGVSLYVSGILRYADGVRPVAGADVEFRQSGGLPLQPGRTTARTNQDGIFTLAPHTVDETAGEIVGDFVVRVPGATTPIVLPGIRVSTIDWEPPLSRPLGVFTLPLAAPASGAP